MVAANNAIDNTVGASISGVTNTLTVTNASNTASSAARETIVVGGGTAGDPTLNFNVSGVTNWEMGIDNSVTDNLTISQGTALGTNDVWRMTVAGERTMPLQPAFCAVLDSNDNNVTGDNTAFTIGSGNAWTERFDQGGDFVTTGTFTAPVTGRYTFHIGVRVFNVTAAFTIYETLLNTSNQFYFNNTLGAGKVFDSRGHEGVGSSYLTDMDAADTATFVVSVSGGTKTVGVLGSAGSTYFQGALTV